MCNSTVERLSHHLTVSLTRVESQSRRETLFLRPTPMSRFLSQAWQWHTVSLKPALPRDRVLLERRSVGGVGSMWENAKKPRSEPRAEHGVTGPRGGTNKPPCLNSGIHAQNLVAAPQLTALSHLGHRLGHTRGQIRHRERTPRERRMTRGVAVLNSLHPTHGPRPETLLSSVGSRA